MKKKVLMIEPTLKRGSILMSVIINKTIGDNIKTVVRYLYF